MRPPFHLVDFFEVQFHELLVFEGPGAFVDLDGFGEVALGEFKLEHVVDLECLKCMRGGQVRMYGAYINNRLLPLHSHLQPQLLHLHH